jgi:catechol 2,3-dioxygenase-like lactoylglutathione lyase family enzyme
VKSKGSNELLLLDINTMKQSIAYVALVVRDYDEAIEFYTKKLHFTLIEDTYQPEQDEAPSGLRPGYLLPALRRERNPSEAESASRSSTSLRSRFSAKGDKRWVVVAPPGSSGTKLLLARASKPEQEPFIGNQSGGRVFLFLNTDDFRRDYKEMVSLGIKFVRKPKVAPYGTVAVFKDLYGNLWDLIELKK